MSTPKSVATALARLFDAAPDPLYVLDQRRTIIFCNEACAEWVGLPAADLIGRRVDYVAGDPDAGPPGMAAGLCPPPAAFAGQAVSGHVSCLSSGGRLLHRRARFVPLRQGEAECEGVVAFVDPVDLHPTELSRDLRGETADQLHVQIQNFRARLAKRHGLEQLIGVTPVMQQVRAQVAVAAETRANVLIIGPSGSGRAHVARSIFYQSTAQRQQRLVPIEAAQPKSDVLRQAFQTLAADDEVGPGAILLLDADAMPETSQTVLLEMLQTCQRPPRLLVTARESLLQQVERGKFEEALARQLSTIEIELPALAERLEDLPLLAQALLERGNETGGKQLGEITPEALDLLALHKWPGNLDELAEVMLAAHAAAKSHQITVDDLPPRIRHAAHAAAFPPRVEETIALEEFLMQIETELITRALDRASGNKTKAAKLLGMTRPRFYRRLETLGLVVSSEKVVEEIEFIPDDDQPDEP